MRFYVIICAIMWRSAKISIVTSALDLRMCAACNIGKATTSKISTKSTSTLSNGAFKKEDYRFVGMDITFCENQTFKISKQGYLTEAIKAFKEEMTKGAKKTAN